MIDGAGAREIQSHRSRSSLSRRVPPPAVSAPMVSSASGKSGLPATTTQQMWHVGGNTLVGRHSERLLHPWSAVLVFAGRHEIDANSSRKELGTRSELPSLG